MPAEQPREVPDPAWLNGKVASFHENSAAILEALDRWARSKKAMAIVDSEVSSTVDPLLSLTPERAETFGGYLRSAARAFRDLASLCEDRASLIAELAPAVEALRAGGQADADSTAVDHG